MKRIAPLHYAFLLIVVLWIKMNARGGYELNIFYFDKFHWILEDEALKPKYFAKARYCLWFGNNKKEPILHILQ